MSATSSSMVTVDQSSFLRAALRIDGLFCLTSGTVTLMVAPFAEQIGAIAPVALIILGLGVIAGGVILVRGAHQPAGLASLAYLALATNLTWLLASAAILLSGWPALTSLGWWLVVGLADLVLLVSIAELIGLRRLQR